MLRLLFAIVLLVSVTADCQEVPSAETGSQELKLSAARLLTDAVPHYVSLAVANRQLLSGVERYDSYFAPIPMRQAPRATQTAAPPPPRPKMVLHGSMVGYIEQPIPQSLVRIRFDSAFNDPTPDRAEFFYAKCGCYGQLAAGTAFDPNTPGPGFGNPPPDRINFQQLHFKGEYAFTPRASAVLELPLRWVQAQGPGTTQAFGNSGGISDLRLGLKYALLAGESTYVTLQFKSSVPTGDASRGLGTNHATIEPMLLLYHALSERLAVEAQFGDTHPLSGSAPVPTNSGAGTFAGDVMTYGVGPSYQFIRRNSLGLAPVVELVGWHVYGGYKTGGSSSTDGANIVNIKFGGRLGIGQHHSLYAGYGRGLSTAIWYQDIARFEYRYAF